MKRVSHFSSRAKSRSCGAFHCSARTEKLSIPTLIFGPAVCARAVAPAARVEVTRKERRETDAWCIGPGFKEPRLAGSKCFRAFPAMLDKRARVLTLGHR